MLIPPTIPPWELFLACPVVQKCSSSFQGDTGRLKVKAIGTNLGFGEESSACYASICCLPQKRPHLVQAELGGLEIRTRREGDGFSTHCPWGYGLWAVLVYSAALSPALPGITQVSEDNYASHCPVKTEEEAEENGIVCRVFVTRPRASSAEPM